MSIFDSISKAANKWLDKLEGQFPEYVIEQKITQKKQEWKRHLQTAATISEQKDTLEQEKQDATQEKTKLQKIIEQDPSQEAVNKEHLLALDTLLTELNSELEKVTNLESENQEALEQCAQELQELKNEKLVPSKTTPVSPLDQARAKLDQFRDKTQSKSPAERAKERLKKLKQERVNSTAEPSSAEQTSPAEPTSSSQSKVKKTL